jgi:ATP-binding cassette, subfamily B, bacterial
MQEEPREREGYNRFLREICSARPFSYLAVIILSVSGMLFAIISPLIMRSLIDDVLIGKNTTLLIPLLAAMAGVFLVSALSNYLSARVRGTLSIGLYREFSLRVFARLQRADYAHVRKFKTGDLLSRITGNVTTVVQTAIRTIPQILVIILGIVLPLVIMISMDAALTAIVILPALLFVVSAAWFGKRMKAAQRPALDAEAGIQSFLKETLPSCPLSGYSASKSGQIKDTIRSSGGSRTPRSRLSGSPPSPLPSPCSSTASPPSWSWHSGAWPYLQGPSR